MERKLSKFISLLAACARVLSKVLSVELESWAGNCRFWPRSGGCVRLPNENPYRSRIATECRAKALRGVYASSTSLVNAHVQGLQAQRKVWKNASSVPKTVSVRRWWCCMEKGTRKVVLFCSLSGRALFVTHRIRINKQTRRNSTVGRIGIGCVRAQSISAEEKRIGRLASALRRRFANRISENRVLFGFSSE